MKEARKRAGDSARRIKERSVKEKARKIVRHRKERLRDATIRKQNSEHRLHLLRNQKMSMKLRETRRMTALRIKLHKAHSLRMKELMENRLRRMRERGAKSKQRRLEQAKKQVQRRKKAEKRAKRDLKLTIQRISRVLKEHNDLAKIRDSTAKELKKAKIKHLQLVQKRQRLLRRKQKIIRYVNKLQRTYRRTELRETRATDYKKLKKGMKEMLARRAIRKGIRKLVRGTKNGRQAVRASFRRGGVRRFFKDLVSQFSHAIRLRKQRKWLSSREYARATSRIKRIRREWEQFHSRIRQNPLDAGLWRALDDCKKRLHKAVRDRYRLAADLQMRFMVRRATREMENSRFLLYRMLRLAEMSHSHTGWALRLKNARSLLLRIGNALSGELKSKIEKRKQKKKVREYLKLAKGHKKMMREYVRKYLGNGAWDRLKNGMEGSHQSKKAPQRENKKAKAKAQVKRRLQRRAEKKKEKQLLKRKKVKKIHFYDKKKDLKKGSKAKQPERKGSQKSPTRGAAKKRDAAKRKRTTTKAKTASKQAVLKKKKQKAVKRLKRILTKARLKRGDQKKAKKILKRLVPKGKAKPVAPKLRTKREAPKKAESKRQTPKQKEKIKEQKAVKRLKRILTNARLRRGDQKKAKKMLKRLTPKENSKKDTLKKVDTKEKTKVLKRLTPNDNSKQDAPKKVETKERTKERSRETTREKRRAAPENEGIPKGKAGARASPKQPTSKDGGLVAKKTRDGGLVTKKTRDAQQVERAREVMGRRSQLPAHRDGLKHSLHGQIEFSALPQRRSRREKMPDAAAEGGDIDTLLERYKKIWNKIYSAEPLVKQAD